MPDHVLHELRLIGEFARIAERTLGIVSEWVHIFDMGAQFFRLGDRHIAQGAGNVRMAGLLVSFQGGEVRERRWAVFTNVGTIYGMGHLEKRQTKS